jgi:hypothetical protein
VAVPAAAGSDFPGKFRQLAVGLGGPGSFAGIRDPAANGYDEFIAEPDRHTAVT